MPTTIKAKQHQFLKMLNLASTRTGKDDKSAAFNPVALLLEDGLIKCTAVDENRSLFMVAEFREFDISLDEGKDNELVAVDTTQWIKYISTLSSAENDIEIQITSHSVKIICPTDVATIPASSIEHVNCYVEKIPFKIKDGVALYKNGKLKPETKIEVNTTLMIDLVKRAELIGKKIFPLKFEPPNKFTPIVGDPSRREDASIQSSFDTAIVEGKPMEVVIGGNFEQVFQCLDGKVTIHGISHYPMWVVKETPAYRVCYMIPPKKDTEE